MSATTVAAANKYVEHFNRVVGNYAEALLEDGQGSDRHKRAAQAVDVLMHEYARATELLDFVRFDVCCGPIERSKNSGGDYRALAARRTAQYPLLAEEIRRFTEDSLATEPV